MAACSSLDVSAFLALLEWPDLLKGPISLFHPLEYGSFLQQYSLAATYNDTNEAQSSPCRLPYSGMSVAICCLWTLLCPQYLGVYKGLDAFPGDCTLPQRMKPFHSVLPTSCCSVQVCILVLIRYCSIMMFIFTWNTSGSFWIWWASACTCIFHSMLNVVRSLALGVRWVGGVCGVMMSFSK